MQYFPTISRSISRLKIIAGFKHQKQQIERRKSEIGMDGDFENI